jgi:ferredoxin
MRIESCGGCGNCADFKCPAGAFKYSSTHGYYSASIKADKCNDCGKCLKEIECLCEAITDHIPGVKKKV